MVFRLSHLPVFSRVHLLSLVLGTSVFLFPPFANAAEQSASSDSSSEKQTEKHSEQQRAKSEVAEKRTRPANPKVDVVEFFRERKLSGGFFDEDVKVVNLDVQADKPAIEKPVAEESKPASADQKKPQAVQSTKDNSLDAAKEALHEEMKAAAKPRNNSLVRATSDAPPSFGCMLEGLQNEDNTKAHLCAKEFVAYLREITFRVRQIAELVGEEMVSSGMVDEEDMDGVGQFFDYQFALNADKQKGSFMQFTQDDALARIKSDPQGEVMVYYFFTLSNKYARAMSPDVERLFRVFRGDNRVKIIGLTMGEETKDWAAQYRDYVGLSKDFPIYNGEAVAKRFNVKFLPSLVVLTRNTHEAYLKTGQQTFDSMYQVVRRAQGLPAELTSAQLKAIQIPVGQIEQQQAKKEGFRPEIRVAVSQGSGGRVISADNKKVDFSGSSERF